MPTENPPGGAEQVLERSLPGVRSDAGLGDLDVAGHPVEHQLEQLVLVAHVLVQRRRPGPQPLGHPAHRHALEPVGVEHGQCRLDDRLTGQRRLRGRAGWALPGR